LLKNPKEPGVNIFDVFLQTGADGKTVTKGAQVPAIYNQFFDKFYLANAVAEVPPTTAEKLDGKALDQYVMMLSKARDAEQRKAWSDALDSYAAAIAAVATSEEAVFGLARSFWMLGQLQSTVQRILGR
jgi:hypothetical protein